MIMTDRNAFDSILWHMQWIMILIVHRWLILTKHCVTCCHLNYVIIGPPSPTSQQAPPQCASSASLYPLCLTDNVHIVCDELFYRRGKKAVLLWRHDINHHNLQLIKERARVREFFLSFQHHAFTARLSLVSRATEIQKLSVLWATVKAQGPPSRKILLETNPCFVKHARGKRDGDGAVRKSTLLGAEYVTRGSCEGM